MNTQNRLLNKLLTPVLLLALTFSALGTSPVRADDPVPGTTATRVYGQGGSFITNNPDNGGINANSLALPVGLALESNGSLYVADWFNNRVLFFAAGSTTAGRVYGQGGSFATGTVNKGGISADSLNLSGSGQFSTPCLALDSDGNLYVSDALNNRVLYFPAGSTTAARVYGQGGSFSSSDANNGGISASSLYSPSGLVLDSGGGLYAADSGNNRVLYYPAGSTTASRVYGQGGSFTSNTANTGGISANSLSMPSGLALDSSGDLYVADSMNSRVLVFPSGSTAATSVYGQSGYFTTNPGNLNGVTADSLNSPFGLALGGSGDLFVADSGNNRVLYYPAGSTTASAVYGQGGSFTTNTANNGGISATSLNIPAGLVLGSTGSLYVADLMNNRVLVYPSGPVTSGTPVMEMTGNALFINNNDTSPSLTDGTDFGSVAISGAASQTFTIFNNGTADLHLTDYARVTLSGPDSGNFSVTSAPTTPVAPGEAATFTVLFTPSGTGTFSAAVNIGNDGSLNNLFTFAIQGTGFQASLTTAIRVYGQGGSLITGDPNQGNLNPSADSLFLPSGLAADGSGGLYVADLYNNRVLYYPAGSSTATRVYGQGGSFSTGTANKGGISADSLFIFNNQYPGGNMVLDSSGGLYVADSGNNRVLYYPAGSTTATRVYGQDGLFTTADIHVGIGGWGDLTLCYDTADLGKNSLNLPGGLALDSAGNLYVADTGDSRVLFFPAGTTTATRIYGHAGDFTDCLPNSPLGTPNADSLNGPFGLALDSANNLYVVDTLNHRVLFFPVGTTTATRVYGQGTNFNTNTANLGGTSASADSLSSPFGVVVDGSGDLYVSDTGNNRVLYYPSGGTTATRVYGQVGDFTSNAGNNGGLSADSLYYPSGLALAGNGSLYVADTANSRVLGYSPATLPSPGTPAMSMTGKSHPIDNGSVSPSLANGTDFGIATSPFGAASRDFAIFNTGTGRLNLTGYPRLTFSGPNAGDFMLAGAPPSSPVAPGGAWTIFTVLFRPSALGPRHATISIADDDSLNNPYTFAVQGTGSAVPSVTTGLASAITDAGATLHGTVNANYADTTVTFKYGETSLVDSVTAVESPVTGAVDTSVSATISGLKPATLYHYRVYATNASGTTRGEDMTFTSGCYADITVTSNADDGAGSLRQAIAEVCAGGTIHFDTSLSAGTILLSTSLYPQKNLTIDGSGLAAQVTLSGNHALRVFIIPQGVTVTLDSLKIVDGHNDASGGGILNMGTLTVMDSTVSGSTSDSQGGGIANGGTLTVTNSSIVGNHSYYGGGISSENYLLTVVNSTLQGNSADWAGGGIYLRSGSLTLLNSSLSGNSAGTGGGGGLYISGTLNYANTLIASSTGGDCVSSTIGTNSHNLVQDGSCSAGLSGDPKLAALAENGGPTQTMALQAGSPAIDAADYATCTSDPVNGKDQRGEDRTNPASLCDIGAYELQVSTDTTPPVVDSFIVPSSSTSLEIPISTFAAHDDTGVTGYLITQRPLTPSVSDPGWSSLAPSSYHVAGPGYYSLHPWAKDAVGNISEVYGSPASVFVCATPITVQNGTDHSAGSLREAIANVCPGGTINFTGDLSVGISSGPLDLDKNMTITGAGHQVTINGNSLFGIFHVLAGSSVHLTALTLTKGYPAGNGGAILNEGELFLADSKLDQNKTDGTGGGIYNGTGATLDLQNCTISNNSALYAGGIYTEGTLTISNSTLSDNQATDGGGIFANADVTVTGSTFQNNSANEYNLGGGGIFMNNGDLTVTDSTFKDNSSERLGGGISIYGDGDFTVTGSTFTGNSAQYSGAIDLGYGNNFIANSTFMGNSAVTGGALYNYGYLSLKNSTFSGNDASGSGADIYNAGTMNFANNILANPVSGADCADPYGEIMYNKHNLVEDGTCNGGTVTGFLTGDPNLDLLADNGGPTWTMALLTSPARSPALNAGDYTTCMAAVGDPTYSAGGKDQRGESRASAAEKCDIGAYEYIPLTPGIFSKTSPANGAADQLLTTSLQWTASAEADTYDVCLSTSAMCSGDNWVTGLTASSYAPSGGFAASTTYYWQVRAVNSSGTTIADGGGAEEWHFSTGALPGAFNMLTPTNGASGVSTSPLLTWESSAGADHYSYCLAISPGPCNAFTNNGNSTSKQFEDLSPDTAYIWRVRASNSFGITSANGSTSTWSFTTTSPTPGSFTKTSPANGAADQLLSTSLQWTASAEADTYDVCLTTRPACWEWTTGLTTTSYAPSGGFAASTTYYWQVRAVNSSGTTIADGGGAEEWHFSTGAPPAAFGKSSPLDSTIGVATDPNLSWESSARASSYEYCYDTATVCDAWTSAGTNTSVALSGLANGQTYYWQARAVNANGDTQANDGAYWSFTVQKADQAALTLLAGSPLTYNQSETLSANGGSTAGLVSYTLVSGPCTLNGDQLKATSGTGTCVVHASMAGNGTYNPVTSPDKTIILQKAVQTITITTSAPPNKLFDTSFSVAASATSGLAVTYSAAGGCSNEGAAFTMTSGTIMCTVKYDQPGDDNFNPAPQRTEDVKALKANQAALTLTAGSPLTYNQSETLSVSGGTTGGLVTYTLVSGPCTLNGNQLKAGSGTGTCLVHASMAGNDNYLPVASSPDNSVTLQKASQSITITTSAPASAAYFSTFTVGASASSGLAVTYGAAGSCALVTGATFRMTSGSGTCTISYNQPGDAFYNPAPQKTETVNAAKAQATVTFDSNNPAALQVSTTGGSLNTGGLTNFKVYVESSVGNIANAGLNVALSSLAGGNNYTLFCTSSVSGSIKTFTCSNTVAIQVGTYDVTATITGGYYSGVAYDGFTVYDPSLGYATGGGWFSWPITGEKTTFGFVMKYKKGGTSPKGSLLVVRHFADGTVARLKSNALTALALRTTGTCGIATFSGKATYMEWVSGAYVNTGNKTFTVYASDCNNPGTGLDSFWVRSVGKLSMPGTGSAGAIAIGGGNIAIPHIKK